MTNKAPKLDFIFSATNTSSAIRFALPSNFLSSNSIEITAVCGTIAVDPGNFPPPNVIYLISPLFTGERGINERYRSYDSGPSGLKSFPHFAIPIKYDSSFVEAGVTYLNFSSIEQCLKIDMPRNREIKLMNDKEQTEFAYFVLKQNTVSGTSIGSVPFDYPPVDMVDSKALVASIVTVKMRIERDQGKEMIYKQNNITHVTSST